MCQFLMELKPLICRTELYIVVGIRSEVDDVARKYNWIAAIESQYHNTNRTENDDL